MEVFPATKEKKKGRAKGGILIGIKKVWITDTDYKITKIEEGLIVTEFATRLGKVKVWSVYNVGKIEEYWSIWEKLDYTEEGIMIIGGDFNIRIGNEGKWGEAVDHDKVENRRPSKDKVIGNGGRKMIEFISNKGWSIANGNYEGDSEGEYTFIGARGSTVIDYVIINEKAKEKVRNFWVEKRVESDHAPISLEIESIDNRKEVERMETESRKEDNKKEIISWAEEDIEVYKAQTEVREEKEEEEFADTVEGKWKEIKSWIEKSVKRKEVKKKR